MGKKKIRTRKIVRDPRFTTTNVKGRRAVSVASLRTAAERQEKKDSYGEALQRKLIKALNEAARDIARDFN